MVDPAAAAAADVLHGAVGADGDHGHHRGLGRRLGRGAVMRGEFAIVFAAAAADLFLGRLARGSSPGTVS